MALYFDTGFSIIFHTYTQESITWLKWDKNLFSGCFALDSIQFIQANSNNEHYTHNMPTTCRVLKWREKMFKQDVVLILKGQPGADSRQVYQVKIRGSKWIMINEAQNAMNDDVSGHRKLHLLCFFRGKIIN